MKIIARGARDMNAAALRAESRKRFPAWSRRMRAKWVHARLYAAAVVPRWGFLVPMTMEQLRWTEAQFTSRRMQ